MPDDIIAKALLQILRNQEHIMNEQRLNHSHERGLKLLKQTSELCEEVSKMIELGEENGRTNTNKVKS